MKNISPALKAALSSEQYIQALLLSINVYADTFLFTTWDEPLLFEGSLYIPRGMAVQSINYNAANIVNNVTMNVGDVDRALLSVLGDVDAGVFPVKITYCVLSTSDMSILGNVEVFTGNISQWEYVPGKVKITAASIFEQWGRVTTSKFSGSCRWRVFRGAECTYTGTGIRCDRTYDQCVAYSNEDNFGGFRWLPSMVNKRLKL